MFYGENAIQRRRLISSALGVVKKNVNRSLRGHRTLPDWQNDEDQRIPNHMRYEHLEEIPRFVEHEAPEQPADEGGEDQHRISGCQMHARVKYGCREERASRTPSHSQVPLDKSTPVKFLPKTYRKEEEPCHQLR